MLPTAARLSRGSTVGWIGLGAMGHPMALNLFTKTYLAHQAAGSSTDDAPRFLICEADSGRADAFVAELKDRGGSELASRVDRVGSGKEMAASASRILTMLPSTPQVQSVYLDPKTGILPGLLSLPSNTPLLPRVPSSSVPDQTDTAAPSAQPNTLLVDGTTLDPTVAMEVAKRIHEETGGKALMIDAPVSGGIVAAKAGTLTIMFGSPSPIATSLAVPFLQRMARDDGVIPCGSTGAGVGVKVCNNLILAINQIALAEGLALGRSLGIDPVLLHNVVNTSSGQSWSSRVNSPLPEVANSPGSRGYSGGFQSRLMLKDVGLALHAAHQYDLPTPLGWAAKSVYEAVCNDGQGEWAAKDFSVVFEWLKKLQVEGVERGWKDGAPGQ
ncbi:hypothetical protein EHS25_008069 [Saitozyma podzolica]|uniref:3-hydroxyisobutyrate dehydrogenase n=1 Tax=Saitozyma podzolica TaxID=1890683 RepID=A0A427YND9_9TREE|nr:hypothetical protein EHS25_008069 [Saitozyma podzolica]